MPNANRIFGLFDDGRDDTPPQDIYIDFMNTPSGKIGMFVKLIHNNVVFNQKLKQFFKQVDKEFDEQTTKSSSEFTVFSRAWHYIKDIDVDNDEHLYALVKQDTQYLLEALKRAVKHFEVREEYEKCAHIHKIEKTVKTF